MKHSRPDRKILSRSKMNCQILICLLLCLLNARNCVGLSPYVMVESNRTSVSSKIVLLSPLTCSSDELSKSETAHNECLKENKELKERLSASSQECLKQINETIETILGMILKQDRDFFCIHCSCILHLGKTRADQRQKAHNFFKNRHKLKIGFDFETIIKSNLT